jgi:N-acetylglucosaminyl-diphospho-decaprenol L-rhamnosyltransferase
VVVVTHNSAEHLPELLAAIADQLGEDDEVVIVDNASSDNTAAVAGGLGKHLRVIETGANLGFAGGCHVGAEATAAPLLLFLNPDSRPEPGCLQALREAATAHPDWGAWQAAVLLEGERINTSGGVVHYLGIGWAGDCGRPLAELPLHDVEVSFPSGAAMIVRRGSWDQLGGLDREYFMYGEDLALGLRLWLCGQGVGMVPSARVRHSYDFDKGSAKWFWLERNRWRTVLSVYPPALLALLIPALLAAELGLLAIAWRGGWLKSKLSAQLAVIRGLPASLALRRRVQATRTIGSRQFAKHLTASLDSPYLLSTDTPLIVMPQSAYWRAVRAALSMTKR